MRCNYVCSDEKPNRVSGRQRKKRPKDGDGLAVVVVVVVEDGIVKGPVVNEAAPEGGHYVIIPTPYNCLRGRRGLAATAILSHLVMSALFLLLSTTFQPQVS